MTRAPLAAAVALALCACGGGAKPVDPFRRAMADGDRAMSAGRHAEAADRFRDAARHAARPRDRDLAEYAAAMALRRTDPAKAAEQLDAIARRAPAGAHAAEAAYHAADLRLAAGDEERGWAGLEDVVTRFPDSGVARPALKRVLRRRDSGGPAASLAYLGTIAPRVDASPLAEDVAYYRAGRMAEAGDVAAARDAYLAMAERWRYPFGSLWDDALYRASEMEEKLGRYPEAIAPLERMLKEREEAHTLGSYERPRYTPALMRIAQLRSERLGDRDGARAAYHRLYAEHTHSPMRDDALWREAGLWRLDGRDDKACDRLQTLASDFPDSRYVPCAVAQCPGVRRPEKSKAPATCHAYITRAPAKE